MYKVISFGHRCTAGIFMKGLNVKTESYPFDWIFSNLNIVKHCIEDNFETFLNKKYYTRICDKSVTNKHKINIQKHIYYFPKGNIMFNHHNPLNSKDYNYFVRCVNRFKSLLKNKSNKLFIYYHRNYENKPFDENNKLNIIEFNDFLKMHTKNYTILSIYVQKSNTSSLDYIKYENIDFVNINIIGGMNGVKFTNKEDEIKLNKFIKKNYSFSTQIVKPKLQDGNKYQLIKGNEKLLNIKAKIIDLKKSQLQIKPKIIQIKPKIIDFKKSKLQIKPKIIDFKKSQLQIKPKIIQIKPKIINVKKSHLQIKPKIIDFKKKALQIKPIIADVKQPLKFGLKLFIKSKK